MDVLPKRGYWPWLVPLYAEWWPLNCFREAHVVCSAPWTFATLPCCLVHLTITQTQVAPHSGNQIEFQLIQSTIYESLKKTRRLIIVDTTNASFSIGSEIQARAHRMPIQYRSLPTSLSCPDEPCPTSTALTEYYYPTKASIANAIRKHMGLAQIEQSLTFEELHLPPQYIFEIRIKIIEQINIPT